jgi:hypothetical protein
VRHRTDFVLKDQNVHWSTSVGDGMIVAPSLPTEGVVSTPLSKDRMKSRSILCLTALGLVAGVPGCFGPGGNFKSKDSYAKSAEMEILAVSNGFGRLLPHVIFEPRPDGSPSQQPIEIRSIDDLIAARPSDVNPILPPATWRIQANTDTGAIEPLNVAGNLANHFVAVEFSRSINMDSVLASGAGAALNSGLNGVVTFVSYDQATGASEPLVGRSFINGMTYSGNPAELEQWVQSLDGSNNSVEALVDEAVGYPGTDDNPIVPNGAFQGAAQFINPRTLVFVVDTDNDLSTYEALPQNRVIRIVIGDAVRDTIGQYLKDSGVATSMVDQDSIEPQLLVDGVGGPPVTVPADLSVDVACDTTITWSFDESCQPHSLGPLPSLIPPGLSNEFVVEFLPPIPPGMDQPGVPLQMPFTVLPASPFNFTSFVVTPSNAFPGKDPQGATSEATIVYSHNAAEDLFANQDALSLDTTEITFTVGSGCPGLVNAPVAPGAIYAASNGGGETAGMRVIDLDGFGQGTGDPTHNDLNQNIYDRVYDAEGHPISGDVAIFPFNPNLGVQDLFPPLSRDFTTLAGGSRGVFTLTLTSSLTSQLVDGGALGNVADMMIGHPLDLVFNNNDCLAGTQNNCASGALQLHPVSLQQSPGNSIQFAPHPNPPRLTLVPACFSPLIQTEEPTFGDQNRDGSYATNLLVHGDSFGTLGGNGPSGLLTTSSTYGGTNFYGPAPSSNFCPTFTLRQQVGHFLYVIDTVGERIVVLNSNRMTVLDSIPVADPVDMAMSTDMNTMAVSSRSTNTVTLIDTDPFSLSFHTRIKSIELVDEVDNRRGRGPGELVWQPDDEDILVVCEHSNSVAFISTGDFRTRKIIPGVPQPRLITATARDVGFGFQTGLYYAYVVSQDGRMAVFESGPDGPQGIGYDDFIGQVSIEGQTSAFIGATALQPNPSSPTHAAFVGYREENEGAVAEVFMKSAPTGPRSLSVNAFVPDPNFRSKEFTTNNRWTGVFSSGSVVDLAVDDLNNIGDTIAVRSAYTGGGSILHSSKAINRPVPGGKVPVSLPRFLFVANANGFVDVVDLESGDIFIDPIRVPGVRVLAHYWRQ